MKCAVYILIISINLVFSVPEQKWRESDDGSKYYIETYQHYNWFESWNECARKNLSLIAIDTYYKHQQIDNLLTRLYNITPSFWTSGHDNAVDDHYEWATTGNRFSFTNWGPKQPSNKTDAHCIVIWIDFQWHDERCNEKRGYICEENQLVKEECHLKRPNETSDFINHLLYLLHDCCKHGGRSRSRFNRHHRKFIRY